MKFLRSIAYFATAVPAFLLSFSLSAQEMPPGNLLVNTICSIAHGHTVEEVVRVGRAIEISDNGPNYIFYRRPMSSGPFPEDFLVRMVYWDSMEHWASYDAGESSGPGSHLRELLTCDLVNRTYWVNREVAPGNSSSASENEITLMATRRCRMKPGSAIADLYTVLVELNAPYLQQGSSTQLQLSQRFIGGNDGIDDMGTLVAIRLVGENSMALASRLDSSTKYVGTDSDWPLENCGDWTLFRSYVVHAEE